MSDAWGKCANCGETLFGLDRCCMTDTQRIRPLPEHEPPEPEEDDYVVPDEPAIWIGDRI